MNAETKAAHGGENSGGGRGRGRGRDGSSGLKGKSRRCQSNEHAGKGGLGPTVTSSSPDPQPSTAASLWPPGKPTRTKGQKLRKKNPAEAQLTDVETEAVVEVATTAWEVELADPDEPPQDQSQPLTAAEVEVATW